MAVRRPSPPPLRIGPVRRALCVALRYDTFCGQHPQYKSLPGTYRDVERIHQLLTDRFRYRPEDITVMKDDGEHEAPTRENLLRAMRELVKGALPGDRFVFHFSGHGSQKPNLDGTEKDGMDEAIWPADIQYNAANNDVDNVILDDEINDILVEAIPAGAHLVIIFDCCHSGTAADLPHTHSDHYQEVPSYRISHRKNALNFKPSDKVTMLSPGGSPDEDALDTAISPQTPTSANTESTEGPTRSSKTRMTPMVVSWAACQDPRRAYGQEAGGWFIRAFVEVLSTESPETSHEVLLHLIKLKMKEYLINSVAPEKRKKHRKALAKLTRPQLGALHDYPTLLISPVASVF